ncbi:MAG: hypothetical protein U9Q27_02500, partial [Patescibacteria group bacterium]|nr:hypothetical protein [Patescibacteria group bacterium]
MISITIIYHSHNIMLYSENVNNKNNIQSETILLILPEKEKENLFSYAPVLDSLKKIHKKVKIIWEQAPKELPSALPKKKFTLFINNKNKNVSEVNYEKDNNYLKINFELKDKNINPKDIFFYCPCEIDDEIKRDKKLSSNNSVNKIKLLSRVLQKISFDKNKQIHYFCLENKDFQETETNSNDLNFVMKKIMSEFYNFFPLLAVWEGMEFKKFIRACFFSDNSGLF